MAEFLPLCDLLFNVVSLAAYFCDLVFDILVVYALFQKGIYVLFFQCLGAIILSTFVSQILSMHWYLQCKSSNGWQKLVVIVLHILQLGVLWRYARLLVPVHLSSVKREVRDLCILRLMHGFLQAAPMLLLQLTLLPGAEGGPQTDLIKVSSALSLFSICWALASFSKHIQSIDRLVLTWLGVVSQLLWRGGTVTARVLALSAYAASYSSWVFLVLALHWACMFLWLLSPRSPFHGQRGSKLGVCALIAAIYILAYINLQDKPHRITMGIFYVVMLLENCLLVGAWVAAIWSVKPLHWELVPIFTVSLFAAGIIFMLVYYKFFHVKRLMEKPSQPPGVFNCRFSNPSASALYRKKKKPTTFVPPPGLGPVSVPFWRRPLPSSSENEGSSVGSRVNIHQKLQEKKQKQLAELKIIEEEIKQGKLVGPEGAEFDDRQPIPRAKRHVEPQLLSLASLNNLANYGVLARRPPPRAPRSRTPELLLAPRYLYCECTIPEPEITEVPVPHTSSDLESQVSLPRSYTLPREFKYYRRQRMGRPIHPIPSTNSSDGDVDSGDDESDCNPPPPTVVRPLRRHFRHETKL
ncbi:XK-related protein 7-like [Diorhabda carinulata]|uniref:XK-related protein 7-like n=1 Tax=Diorhabda sublineata TaxID=1163346 RepID=UPI0024E07C5F|nr:XK-related protein 7-like [Diorhabda sublineata]XP_057666901.1 XK-related protein 7-like [Diorhabda carinulata]XP_057666902.1 XK-related protein 7-like [Diorhabda carinulata]